MRCLINFRCFTNLYIFVLAIFSSCGDSGEVVDFKSYFEGTEQVFLTGNTVALVQGDKPLSYMFNMTYFDSLILVNEFPDREYTYKLIDLRDRSVRPFGRKGEGPNQLLSDAFYFSVDKGNKKLYLTDNVHYYVFDVDSLRNGFNEPISRFTIDQQDRRFMGSTVFADGYIVGSMYHRRFCAYHVEKQSFIEVGEYEGGPDMALANQAFYMNHPSKNQVVYGMSRVPEFGILTILEDSITVSTFSWGRSPLAVEQDGRSMRVLDSEDTTYEFTSVSTTKDHVYFLYSGKKIDTSSRESMMDSGLSKDVFVMDWNGKPVKRYILDQPTRCITVDEESGILYTASFESDPRLVAYALK